MCERREQRGISNEYKNIFDANRIEGVAAAPMATFLSE
jgi:hypothetical protein